MRSAKRPKLPPLKILRKQIEANRRKPVEWPDGEPPIPPGVREKGEEFGLHASGAADWTWYPVGDVPSKDPATGYCRCRGSSIRIQGMELPVGKWDMVEQRPTADGGLEAVVVASGEDAPAARPVLMYWFRYLFQGRRRHVALGQCDLCLRVLWHAPGLSRDEPEHASQRRRR